jgi:hypothetical protein
MLTCFSALLCLLAIYNRNETVHPGDVVSMIKLSPTLRLEWLLDQEDCKAAHEALRRLIAQYENFLSLTNRPKAELIEMFQDKNKALRAFDEANSFGDAMFEALIHLRGKDQNRFFRLLVV